MMGILDSDRRMDGWIGDGFWLKQTMCMCVRVFNPQK
jgi:hypothetical protein